MLIHLHLSPVSFQRKTFAGQIYYDNSNDGSISSGDTYLANAAVFLTTTTNAQKRAISSIELNATVTDGTGHFSMQAIVVIGETVAIVVRESNKVVWTAKVPQDGVLPTTVESISL